MKYFTNQEHILTALLATVLLTIAGCGPSRDYTKLDPRCKDWLRKGSSRAIISSFDSSSASMEDQYEHYMCIHMPYHHSWGGEEYFVTHWHEFLLFIPGKLMSPRTDNEIFHISILLMDIAKHHKNDILNDTFLLKTWKNAIDNIKQKHTWAYSVSNGFYDIITKQPDPSSQHAP